ncbi:MAG: hypothetical protein E7058_10320 [Lentisphaerae bacterium]|nr:hypothetical protein [Lentisphaerota bacterium]
MDIAIYGTGGLGKEMAFLAEEAVNGSKNIIFIDDTKDEDSFFGHPMYTFEKFCEKISPENCQVVIALGEPALRAMLAERVTAAGYPLGNIAARSANISKHAVIGAGVVIFHNCIIMPDVVIGENTVLQTSTTLTHDDHVGKNSVLSHKTTVGGSTVIGQNSFIGMGAVLRDHISIGNSSIVGMGAVVTKSFPDNSVLVGAPAELIRQNDNSPVFKKK